MVELLKLIHCVDILLDTLLFVNATASVSF